MTVPDLGYKNKNNKNLAPLYSISLQVVNTYEHPYTINACGKDGV